MKADSLFTEHFEFPEGISHDRCEKPSLVLEPHRHWSMDLPGDFGRATLDTYKSRAGIYSRAVAMKTGEVAWFRVSRTAKDTAKMNNEPLSNSRGGT